MIISDLNHVEVVSQNTAEISGGTTILIETFNDALAAASADAKGLATSTSTVTLTSAGGGKSSSVSISSSTASDFVALSLTKK